MLVFQAGYTNKIKNCKEFFSRTTDIIFILLFRRNLTGRKTDIDLTELILDKLISFVIHVIHMKKDVITVRDVDEKVLRNFRARAIQKKMKMGEALTDAMKRWLKEDKIREPDPKLLLKIKPFDWGPGTEKTSEEVDAILYGSK